MTAVQYLEDFSPGQKFTSGNVSIDAESIKTFAAQYDPQPFHLDEAAATQSLFRGLAASGWHTAALSMRLFVLSDFKPAGGIVGAGLEELKWPKPVRPGDVLSAETEILDVRPSKSKPEQGIVRVKVTTFNQYQEVVQTFTANLVVKVKTAITCRSSNLIKQ